MPSSIQQQYPYRNLPEDELVKAQCLVSAEDKTLLMSIYPDRGINTLLIQYAYKHAADFIRKHSLSYQSSDVLIRAIEESSFRRTTPRRTSSS